MKRRTYRPVYPISESQRSPIVADGVFAMLIFVIAESMLFAGFISAFAIMKSGSILWPPPNQPRLPFEETALNTAALLASGVALYLGHRIFRKDPVRSKPYLIAAMLLAVFFVAAQGLEWLALIQQGLTLTSSSLGSFFYVIIGVHALHAIAAVCGLAYATVRLHRGWLPASVLGTVEVFWYFVVAVWPVLYLVVYF